MQLAFKYLNEHIVRLDAVCLDGTKSGPLALKWYIENDHPMCRLNRDWHHKSVKLTPKFKSLITTTEKVKTVDLEVPTKEVFIGRGILGNEEIRKTLIYCYKGKEILGKNMKAEDFTKENLKKFKILKMCLEQDCKEIADKCPSI